MSAYDDVRAGKDVPLEDLLRDLAARGELTHLSIVAVAGKGPGGVVYSGSFTPAAQFGHGFSRDADPVKAIFEAVRDKSLKRLVKILEKSGAKIPPELGGDAEGKVPDPDEIIDDSEFA